MDAASFLARLREAMVRQGLSQKDLAIRLGVRQATVSAWFQNTQLPGGLTMLRLPETLAVDGHWLLTGEHRAPVEHAPETLVVLLERALRLVRENEAEANAQELVRLREASEDELRALNAVRRRRPARPPAARPGT